MVTNASKLDWQQTSGGQNIYNVTRVLHGHSQMPAKISSLIALLVSMDPVKH